MPDDALSTSDLTLLGRLESALERRAMYPTDLTSEEIALDFRLALISNDCQEFLNQPSIICVVLYAVGPMSVVLKVRDDAGNIKYSHRLFGRREKNSKPIWGPVLAPTPSASHAISVAKEVLDAHLARYSGVPEIDPALPSLDLRCPLCTHEFTLARDYIDADAILACPNCKRESG
jgi:hypothetical protein